MRFRDRREAGRLLARALAGRPRQRPLVLGIPRGGLVVADEVARALGAPLDVFGAAKVGAPFNPELALAAVAPGGVLVLNEDLAARLGVTARDVEDRARARAEELEARLRRLRRGRPPLPVAGRTAILVDDGIATGLTVAAAVAALRREGPARLVLAVPVCSPEAAADLRPQVDELVCLVSPRWFRAVGEFYEDFGQVTDEEAAAVLDAAAAPAGEDAGAAPAPDEGDRD